MEKEAEPAIGEAGSAHESKSKRSKFRLTMKIPKLLNTSTASAHPGSGENISPRKSGAPSSPKLSGHALGTSSMSAVEGSQSDRSESTTLPRKSLLTRNGHAADDTSNNGKKMERRQSANGLFSLFHHNSSASVPSAMSKRSLAKEMIEDVSVSTPHIDDKDASMVHFEVGSVAKDSAAISNHKSLDRIDGGVHGRNALGRLRFESVLPEQLIDSFDTLCMWMDDRDAWLQEMRTCMSPHPLASAELIAEHENLKKELQLLRSEVQFHQFEAAQIKETKDLLQHRLDVERKRLQLRRTGPQRQPPKSGGVPSEGSQSSSVTNMGSSVIAPTRSDIPSAADTLPLSPKSSALTSTMTDSAYDALLSDIQMLSYGADDVLSPQRSLYPLSPRDTWSGANTPANSGLSSSNPEGTVDAKNSSENDTKLNVSGGIASRSSSESVSTEDNEAFDMLIKERQDALEKERNHGLEMAELRRQLEEERTERQILSATLETRVNLLDRQVVFEQSKAEMYRRLSCLVVNSLEFHANAYEKMLHRLDLDTADLGDAELDVHDSA